MISKVRQRHIQALARAKLVEYDRMRLPVDPIGFAREELGIRVQSFEPPQPDISGFLMRVGDEFGIGYSTAIKSTGFQNFTVAHELGHYFIEDHPMAVLEAGRHLSRSGYISKDRFEREADIFATEFLMPWKLIQPIIGGQQRGFAAIKALSGECASSLLAAANRYAAVTSECVAVIVSHRGEIEYMLASDSFRQIPGIDWLKRADSVPASTPSAPYATDVGWLSECEVVESGSVLNDWFPDCPSLEVEEDIVGLGSYQRLLTILITDWSSEEEEQEDEEEDDYIERWKEGRHRPRKR